MFEQASKKMTDRFKFRAWDYKNKVMLYNIGIVNNIAHAVKAADCDFSTMDGKFIMYEGTNCDKVPFMQCTGLKDANGKLIYEGDILLIPDIIDEERQGEIVMTDDAEWKLKDEDGDFLYKAKDYRTGEVIGNIYENPKTL